MTKPSHKEIYKAVRKMKSKGPLGSIYLNGFAAGRALTLKRVGHLEELVCVAWDYLKGHYDLTALPLRDIGKEVKKILVREKRKHAIQRTK